MTLSKTFATAVTASSVTAKTIQSTAPSGEGVFVSGVRIIPFLTAANDATGTINVYRWIPTAAGEYVPVLQGIYTVTAGTQVGAADKTVADTDYFADTIAVSSSSSDGTEEIVAGGQNGIAELRIPQRGAAYIEIELAKGTATTINCLAGEWKA